MRWPAGRAARPRWSRIGTRATCPTAASRLSARGTRAACAAISAAATAPRSRSIAASGDGSRHSPDGLRRSERVGPEPAGRRADHLDPLGLHQSPRHVLSEPLDDPPRRHRHGPLLRQLHAQPVQHPRSPGDSRLARGGGHGGAPITTTRRARSSSSTRAGARTATPRSSASRPRSPSRNPKAGAIGRRRRRGRWATGCSSAPTRRSASSGPSRRRIPASATGPAATRSA